MSEHAKSLPVTKLLSPESSFRAIVKFDRSQIEERLALKSSSTNFHDEGKLATVNSKRELVLASLLRATSLETQALLNV